MYNTIFALEGLSTYLRCWYRPTTSKVSPILRERLLPRRELRRFTSQRPFGQEAALQHSSDDLIHHANDLVKYEPHKGPIITYEPRGSATLAQTQARKHSLGLDVLGQPAEILIIQHEQDRQRSKLLYAKGPDNEPKANLSIDSSQLLEAISKERGIIGLEQVYSNIQDLRQSTLGQRSDARGIVDDSVLEDLVSKLRNGFTVSQLSAYLRSLSHGRIVVDPFNLQQDYTCRLYSRSSWRVGISSISNHRAPSILEKNSNVKASSHGLQGPRKGAKKDEIIDRIVRQHWRLKPISEESLQGEVDIGLLPIHFDLIFHHRKNILKRISESYGVKIEASRPENMIRVSSDFDACNDIFRLFRYMIKNVKCDIIDIGVGNAAVPTDSSSASAISQVEKLTSTVIREAEDSQSQDLSKGKLSIYYLGSETFDVEDAKRMLMAVTKGSSMKDHKLLWAYEETSSTNIVPSPVEVGANLAMKDRHIGWSRWCAPSSYTPSGKAKSTFSNSSAAAKRKESILPEIVQFLKSHENKPNLDLSWTETPFWKPDLSFASMAKLGQVIFPSSTTKNIQTTLPEQITLASIATHFEATLSQYRREFLTLVAGILKPLNDLEGESTEFENIGIILSPSLPPNASPELLEALPSLELEIGLDSFKHDITLSAARLIMEHAVLDILLPSSSMDIRLSRQTFVDSAALDPALSDFVGSSSLDIWGNERLTTPSDLTLTIPRHPFWSREKGVKIMDVPKANVGEGLCVKYTFTRLEHRSTVRTPFIENTQIDYTIIEAGKTGGRRGELSIINLPIIEDGLAGSSKDDTIGQSGKKLSPKDHKVLSLWRAAKKLVSDIEKP